MIFNSIEFLIFLPLVFLFFWLVLKGRTSRNIFIVGASYLFYGWWDWRFLVLIFFTTLCSFISGLLIEKWNVLHRKKALMVVWTNTGINLGILALFKYYGFFLENLSIILAPLGIKPDPITLNLILPVGISFYTFQALSYSIDVYRGKLKATHDIPAFFAFISFFPQLVAGPIERATNLLPQFLNPVKFSYPHAVSGMRLILWGLFKKVVVADNCAQVVNFMFGHYNEAGALSLWYGALCFTIQIYCDFSGYSDIAIGTARLFGYNLMRNFRLPYFSRDIAEFWRRWHISLTTWFRDYVYIPLGGSRVKKSKVTRNTFVIFLTSGLWHGANFTFIVWGLYHALLFIPLILTGRNRRNKEEKVKSRGLPAMRESIMMGVTFLLVMVGWVIFRADNIQHAWEYIVRMFSSFDNWELYGSRVPLLWITVLIITEWFTRDRQCPLDFGSSGIFASRPARWILYYALFIAVIIYGGIGQTFIYFQF